MEKLALISDIHGNMPAYEAVMNDIQGRNVTQILCLGDLVGKGPHSERIVDLVRETCDVVIKGNWDDFIGNPTVDPVLLWHQNRLGKERTTYLKELPFCYEFWMSGKFVRLFHASPRSVYERIQPWDSMESRSSMFESSEACDERREADVAGYADVHNAFLQILKGRMLFNTGSVGNPLDMTQASYVLLEGDYHSKEAGVFNLQHIRVPYDIELAVQQAKEEGMPDADAYILELRTGQYRGRKK
ncbi:metallophosphoesterase family protein [Paenibacillus sp. GCM10023248]|uniref:metallophosphoesterase family protein n=1 Tax=Bacillales TaxID=1385 RepID=UPI00237850E2|nr:MULTISPECIES: metallophosphoesterase family protein [Bacillales]MDD9270990.1 metallophosphoesterase family protein [Paenibacillus sp. MAHUQ-63]MDR6882874.1 protein phosphatase [Bacillus sp. 3255]